MTTNKRQVVATCDKCGMKLYSEMAASKHDKNPCPIPVTERKLILTIKGWNQVDMNNLEGYIRKMHIKNGRAEVASLNSGTLLGLSLAEAERRLLEIEVGLFAKAGDWDKKNWGQESGASRFLRDIASQIHGVVNTISPPNDFRQRIPHAPPNAD